MMVILLTALALAGTANAASRVVTEYTTTEIIPETNGIAPGETTWFAIRQEVRDHWHVFWVNPGDAGIPLNTQWDLPDGFEVGEILHPAPEYIPVGPLASYAHEGEPVFLVSVTAPLSASPGDMIDVVIDAAWQACEQICVPEDARFEFALPVVTSAERRADASPMFDRARNALPKSHDGEAQISRNKGRLSLQVQPWSDGGADDVFFFPVVEGLTTPAAAQEASVKDGVLTILMEPGWVDSYDAQTLEGVITYQDGAGQENALSVSALVDGPLMTLDGDAPQVTVAASTGGIVWYLVLAFLGGVILNIMPCVFPIIFVKAASFMESARTDQKAVREHGLLFTAGVLSTFALMGGLLLVLRAGGEQLGWGFHLQSPVVVALSAYVLFMVGLNLFGFFHVAESLAGAGDSLTRKGGAAGAFFTGTLAVVVAAPCIGPLLTAPMGAALMQPAAIGMLIFLLMGLGLATPYLVLSFIPSAGRFLPRPGPWMAILKQVLAFPVFAAAAYFLWVFSRQTGATGLAFILAGAVLLALAAWLFEKSKGDGPWAIGVRGASALAALLAVLPLMRIEPAAVAAAPPQGAYGAIASEAYGAERLAAYRAEGTPVFVDFTAAWCVTCQFNKMTVLKSDEVADAFAATGTVLMVADWTVRDPLITEALQAFGASGVPLYAFYPKGEPAQILPPALSRKIVVSALSGAS
ncbi:MAG: thioredoxin family protein [Pseudomonadota bacterium]